MDIKELKEGILKLFQRAGYFEKKEIIDETPNTLKIRFIVNKFCYLQIYVNLRKKLKNYVVVLNNQRIYGIDSDGGRWHKHPWHNPVTHEFVEEIPLEEFLFEVYTELKEKSIL